MLTTLKISLFKVTSPKSLNYKRTHYIHVGYAFNIFVGSNNKKNFNKFGTRQ